MVGAGVELRLHPGRDGGLVAPRHHVVDEPVAAAVGEVVLAETGAAPVAHVVGTGELPVGRDALTGDGAGAPGVGLEHHVLLGRE